MFTPQQLEQITFHTSVFGGYDMDSVDEFLVALIEDYNTLYKYNFVKRLYHSMKFKANINFIILETIKIIDKGMVFDKM